MINKNTFAVLLCFQSICYPAFASGGYGQWDHGIEINLLRMLAWSDDASNSFSGGYSYFNNQRNFELAFPIAYFHDKAHPEDGHSYEMKTLNADIHYRQYLGSDLGGTYLSAFTRATHIDGLLEEGGRGHENKWGAGVGIGYRVITDSGFFWGASFNIGRYFTGENDVFVTDDVSLGSYLADSEYFFDIELLKFGLVF